MNILKDDPNVYISSSEKHRGINELFESDLNRNVPRVLKLSVTDVQLPISWDNIHEGNNKLIIQCHSYGKKSRTDFVLYLKPDKYSKEDFISEINGILTEKRCAVTCEYFKYQGEYYLAFRSNLIFTIKNFLSWSGKNTINNDLILDNGANIDSQEIDGIHTIMSRLPFDREFISIRGANNYSPITNNLNILTTSFSRRVYTPYEFIGMMSSNINKRFGGFTVGFNMKHSCVTFYNKYRLLRNLGGGNTSDIVLNRPEGNSYSNYILGKRINTIQQQRNFPEVFLTLIMDRKIDVHIRRRDNSTIYSAINQIKNIFTGIDDKFKVTFDDEHSVIKICNIKKFSIQCETEDIYGIDTNGRFLSNLYGSIQFLPVFNFQHSESNSINVEVTDILDIIPPGRYEVPEIKEYINKTGVVIDYTNNRFNIDLGTASYISCINTPYLQMGDNLSNIIYTERYISPIFAEMDSINIIYIKSKTLSNHRETNIYVNKKYMTTIARIPIIYGGNNMINISNMNHSIKYNQPTIIKKINLQLVDEDDNLINLNNLNWSCVIKLQIY